MQTQSSSLGVSSLWAGLLDSIRLCGVLNAVSFLVTALGTYLAIKGKRDIKRAQDISAMARRNTLAQVAANEFAECLHQVEMLIVHVGSSSWQMSAYLSSAVSMKLQQTKAFEKELRGINRDALDVSVRTASGLREYLSTTTDPEPEKILKGKQQCLFLSALLTDIHGSLRFRTPAKHGTAYETTLKGGTQVGFIRHETMQNALLQLLTPRGWAQFSVRRADGSELFKVESSSLFLGVSTAVPTDPLYEAVDELFTAVEQKENEDLDRVLSELG